MGTRFLCLPLGIMLWSFMECFVNASVEEDGKIVGGMCQAPQKYGCLWDLRGHV